ncbi:MAG: caspase family protein [Halioglobus sp.]
MKSIAASNRKYPCRRKTPAILIVTLLLSSFLSGCEATPDKKPVSAPENQAAGTPDDFLVVDCLLPGQLRKLGGNFTFLSQRKPIKTAQSDCEIRGGEYVSYDRADYSTALRIWLPLAQSGDPAAQTYVGEIYEKGLGLDSDYPVAAHWYTQAVKSGYARAQINLGHLYEKGLGVKQDKQHALNLYRSASGLASDNLLFASSLSSSHVPKQDYDSVQRELAKEQRRSVQLRQEIARVSNDLKSKSNVLGSAEKQLLVTQAQLEQAVAAQSIASTTPGRSTEDGIALQSTVDEMEGLRVSLEQQIAQLNSQNRELSKSQQLLVQQLSGNEVSKNQYLKKMDVLEREVDQSRTQLAKSEQSLADTREKLTQQQAREQNLTPELLSLQKELDAKNQGLTQEQVKLARMESERSALATQLETNELRMAEYQREFGQLQQRLTTANQEIASSEQAITTLQSQLDTQLAKDAVITPTLLASKYDLEQKNRALASQRDKYTALESEKETLALQLNDTEQHKNDYQRQANQLREQLVSSGTALSSAKSEVNTLKAQLAAAQDAGQKMSPELLALQQDLEKHSRKLTEKKMEFATLEAKNQVQQRQLTDTLAQLERKTQQLNNTDGNNRRDISRLDAQLEEHEQQAAQIGHELLLAKAALHMERANSEEALAQQADAHQEVVQQQRNELEQLTTQFESQFNLVKSQKQQIAELKQQAQNYTLELESADVSSEPYITVAGNGPMIEIIEPPVVLTRSEATVRISTFRGERQVIGKISAPSGLLSLSVNGQTPVLTENNLFRSSIPLTDDPTPVEVVLVDNEGRRAAVTFSFVDQLGNSVDNASKPIVAKARFDKTRPGENVAMGNYHALIIGNNQYQNYSTLVTAVNDARATEKVLREKYRFKTKLLLDANRYQILSALNELRESLGKDDNLLIYYAGHGKIDPKDNVGYWLPVDADADNSINWISNKAITDILNVIEAKHVLVVADSCYAGTLTQTPIARLQTDIPEDVRTQWMKVMAETRARITLTSGGVEPVSDGGGGRHSVFAKAFLDTLSSNDGILEGYSLYSKVLERMASKTSPLDKPQTPLYAPIHLAGHESGEFFFNPRRG